jgi:hypothetical protein
MALTSTSLGAVLFALSRAIVGYIIPLRVVTVSAISAIGKHGSSQRGRALSKSQTEALAAAIAVESYSKSWQGRHQPPGQETRRRLCSDDQF